MPEQIQGTPWNLLTFPQKKAGLLLLLRQLGIASADASYDGSGDEGDFHDWNIYDAANRDLSDRVQGENYVLAGKTENLPTLLFDVGFEAIEAAGHGGWENNDGAYGIVRFYPDEDRIVVEHSERIMDTAYSETAV